MAMYMLDTDIASYIMKRSNDAVLRKLQTIPVSAVCISAIAESELRFGVEISPRRRKDQEALEVLLRFLSVLDYPDSAAVEYGRIRADLQRRGLLIGANDLAELQSRLGVARVKIGMNPLDGTTEGDSEFFGIITRKSSEQIVQRLHRRSHEYSTLSTEIPAEKLPVENYALMLWIVLGERGEKMTELCSLGRLP